MPRCGATVDRYPGPQRTPVLPSPLSARCWRRRGGSASTYYPRPSVLPVVASSYGDSHGHGMTLQETEYEFDGTFVGPPNHIRGHWRTVFRDCVIYTVFGVNSVCLCSFLAGLCSEVDMPSTIRGKSLVAATRPSLLGHASKQTEYHLLWALFCSTFKYPCFSNLVTYIFYLDEFLTELIRS